MTRRRLAIAAGWYVAWVAFWLLARPAIFPSLPQILGAVPGLWMQDGLAEALQVSFLAALEALAISVAISLPLAYLSAVRARVYGFEVRELVRPLAEGVSEIRFLSAGLFFLLLLFVFSSGQSIKIAMLVIGETFFLVKTMLGVVDAVPEERFDDCRTLGMNEWQAAWYAVVRGTLHETLHAIRDNNGMGWAALPMVEGIVRTGGGVGVLVVNNEHHMNFAEVWAIAGAILVVAVLSDYALDYLDRIVCPYAF
jgi:ABC-type nitrate/sulfonate/bicarbonate transport system permease component